MRLRAVSCLMSLVLLPGLVHGEDIDTYLLTASNLVWRVNDTADPAKNAWAVSNSTFAAKAGVWSAAADTNAYAVSRDDNPGAAAFTVKSSEAGFVAERNKPQYYLGDKLDAPADVDWTATYDYYLENFGEGGLDTRDNFLFDTYNKEVYVVRGETSVFKWIVSAGGVISTSKTTVVASPVASGRPKNIFWTDTQYGGRSVDLTGKYVKFYGPSNLLTKVTGYEASGVTIGNETSSNEVVISGVYIDETGGTKTMYAAGRLSGQFVLAYYDSGNYEHLVDVITVQVSRPETIVQTASVGSELKATGRGYGTEGLTASPTTLDDFDDRGPFLYQHSCVYSTSPRDGSVFAIRPSDAATRNQTQIYWMETDMQGVSWPFEVNEYLVSWSFATPVFVRGDDADDVGKGLTIPGDYQVTLMDYQESDIAGETHATSPVDGVFKTTGPGRSLLKLTANDTVWFVPIRSVLRTDTDFFNLNETVLRKVGQELSFRSIRSTDGLTHRRTVVVTDEAAGYIYEPASDRIWNADIYDPSGVAASGLKSVVYPVTAAMPPEIGGVAPTTNAVEVWWSQLYQHEDMPSALTIPTLPQRYQVAWPEDVEASDIVIASQKGSAGESVAVDADGHALAVDTIAAGVNLPIRKFFSKDGGTLGMWVRSSATNGASVTLFKLGSGAQTLMLTNAPNLTGWSYCALTWTTNAISRFMIRPDGTMKTSTKEFAPPPEFTGLVTNTVLGGAMIPGMLIDEVSVWKRPLSTNELAALAFDPDAVSSADRTYHLDFESGEIIRDTESGIAVRPFGCARVSPGAPRRASGVIVADATPTLYRQPDASQVGFNPNEEHAFVRYDSENGGSVVWALRSDLNAIDRMSMPGVLVAYVQDGVQKMRYFDVKLTNETWRTFAGTATAGNQFLGPRPFDLLDKPWLAEDWWDESSLVPYRDRKNQVWARSAGTFDIRMYYEQLPTYDWPASIPAPADGQAVAWLAYVDGPTEFPQPRPWTWTVSWPAENSVPKMKIGQTLTTAADGLPEVWAAKSIAVVWPETNVEHTALLYDPTVKCVVNTDIAYADLASMNFTTDASGKLNLYKGTYYLKDLPPSVSDRIYLDTSDAQDVRIVLIGRKDDDTVGELHVNVLADCERAALDDLVKDVDDDTLADKWRTAVSRLGTAPVVPTVTKLAYNAVTTKQDYQSFYEAADHYAITAMGLTNWVVIIENDATNSFCNAGNPISMHIFRIVPEYDLARVVSREDPANMLSQQLSINYTESFAGKSGDFEFQWGKRAPESNGTVPTIGVGDIDAAHCGKGLTTFVVGGEGDNLANMVNTYWSCRYRATTNSAAYAIMGDAWSDWCTPPGLAEGWVQRVLNNVTPFTQRVTELYEQGVDTSVSMIRQAGAPYVGDVALNQDNLSNVGLIQLYRTILSKAESMSLMLGVNNEGANKQLLMAVERLADMYGVLGDDAYADAINPTIGFGSNMADFENQPGVDFGAASSALFCFDNQMPTLLDEELALMRGRSCVNAPGNTVGPYYNRLVWNFTRGITAGEVAYAVNYDIDGTSANGTLSEEQASAMYPQGHGDAYGHYLSALQGYYRLLRNPYFSWDGIVGMGEMNVADNAVNVDYYDEATFAKFAAKAAKAAVKTVELTALKQYRDNGADAVGGGYVDANATNAFGYGEWASRGGYGALCNWAVANDILPEEETTNGFGVAYEDLGLLHIDRGTAEGIVGLSEAVTAIQKIEDRMDAGMNPLGLNEKAVPFDLTPIAEAGDDTHFEQIRDRALDAFANAKAVLDRAQTHASAIRLNAESGTTLADSLATDECDYESQLIAIYGKPYSDDIGPGKTYPQGYDGPDLYHYMWMNAANYGILGIDSTMVVTTLVFDVEYADEEGVLTNITQRADGFVTVEDGCVLSYSLTADGVVVKDDEIQGARPASGSLQQAYADFLAAYAKVKHQHDLYVSAVEGVEDEILLMKAKQGAADAYQKTAANKRDSLKSYYRKMGDEQKSLVAMESVTDLLAFDTQSGEKPVGVLGLALTTTQDALDVIDGFTAEILYTVFRAVAAGLEGDIANCEQRISECELAIDEASDARDATETKIEVWDTMIETCYDSVLTAVADLSEAWSEMLAAQEEISALVAEARGILSQRELARKQAAKNISRARYNDMFFRRLSNDALAKYDTSFDIAKKYAFLAAKAYGYETGSSLESTEAGRAVLRQIVSARSLGETTEDGEPMVSENGDKGLSGILAELNDNWENRKTQLGINNPQPYATWFSLRHELFRILSTEVGDDAWATELAKYWVEDIKSNAEFKRYCQPFASQFGQAEKEPGLVIPFSTTIDFAYNLFGKPLAFDDHQFDSTYYATKIAAAGVWLEGYNEKREDYEGPSAFALTPNVYLVPVGTDKMRVPGSDGTEIASFDVIDQTIPVPYPLTAAEIAEANWLPSYLDGEMGGVDAETRIRRHPSFRAYYGDRGEETDDECLDATRLTGRSVWNTRWLLVIPAGTLNANREQALKSFIYGLDIDHDGEIDVLPVSDIKIGFRTYSNGGN